MKSIAAIILAIGCTNPTSTVVQALDVDSGVTPDWILGVPRFSVSVSPGQTATYGISVTANSAFCGTVSMSSSGAPRHSTPVFDPSSYTLVPNQEGVGTFKVKTTSRTAPGAYYISIDSMSGATENDGTVTLNVE